MFTRVPVLCLLAMSAGAVRAELVCPQAKADLGELRSGPAFVHAFNVRNQGREPIEVRELKAGCGCLKPVIDRRLLHPGEEATVKVEISTVTQPEGANRWRVTLRYADRELPLEVFAHLVRDVSIRPAALVAHTTMPTTHTFTLTEKRDRPLEVRGVSCSCAHMVARVDLPRREDGGWARTVALSVLSACPDGRHEGVVCVHTGDPSCPELKVPFTIQKQSPGRVHALPAAAEMAGAGALPARVVQLTSAEGVVLVDHVEPDHAAVRCTYCAGPGERSTLRIVVDHERLAAGNFEGRVRVHLRQPPGEVVEVPVRVAR